MKYDKNAISNTAQKLRSKASDLSSIKTRLGRISPTKCSSAFYARRSSLVRRLSNVQSEIKSLSTDIGDAASKMSSDDVQNARYIRQVFNNRTSKINFGQRTFSAGNTALKSGGLFGSSLMYSQMAMNRRPVSSLGNASSGKTPWYVRAGNFITSGASWIGKKAGEIGSNVWNGTTNFFSNAGKWASERFNDVKEWGKSAGDYTWKSIKKYVLGDYSDEDITVLSFGGNILTGIFDVDLPLDVRDFVYDIQHWGEGDHFGVNFALDCVAFLPLIGAVKYVKYADEVADGAKDIGKVMEAASDAGKYTDQAVDASKASKDIGKVVDAAADAGKTSDTVVDVSDASKDLGKAAEVAEEATNYNKAISFKDTCAEHVIKGNGIKGNNIRGAHNLSSFEKTITDAGGTLEDCIVSKVKHPTIEGIYEITYQVPGSNRVSKTVKVKTVYDPSIISYNQLLKWAEEAFTSSDRIIEDGMISGIASNGLMFEGYIDEATGVIRAFYPVLE